MDCMGWHLFPLELKEVGQLMLLPFVSIKKITWKTGTIDSSHLYICSARETIEINDELSKKI